MEIIALQEELSKGSRLLFKRQGRDMVKIMEVACE